MKIASVIHMRHPSRQYWFEIPPRLINDVHDGTKVLCDTRFGPRTGKVLYTKTVDDSELADMLDDGATLPLKKILGICGKVKLSDIRIYSGMKKTIPSTKKIADQLESYRRRRNFSTRIAISHKGYLTDGYSAYLVAKMLDVPALTVVIEPEEEKQNGN